MAANDEVSLDKTVYERLEMAGPGIGAGERVKEIIDIFTHLLRVKFWARDTRIYWEVEQELKRLENLYYGRATKVIVNPSVKITLDAGKPIEKKKPRVHTTGECRFLSMPKVNYT